MTTPRLALVQHLGLAVAHATRTDADWIAECRLELAHALIAQDEDPARVPQHIVTRAVVMNQRRYTP